MKNATSTALLMLVSPLAACDGAAPPAADAAKVDQTERSGHRVASSGKETVPLTEVPADVLSAAQGARPGFVPAEAERETRDGRHYFDIGGLLPDGSEIEFDIMEEDGRWRVVETQRDIAFSEVPAAVRQAATARDAALAPTRVIESVQSDGVVIYELYAAQGGNPQGRKVEVRWDGRRAEPLTEEWAH